MKIKKLFGIIALIAIMGFTITSCGSNLVGTKWNGENGDSIEFVSSKEIRYMGFISAPYTTSGNIIKITFPLLGEWEYERRGNELIVKSGNAAIIGYKFVKD